ncbi:two-component response regulator, partial [Candidatus Magnetobacterium bavaricum]
MPLIKVIEGCVKSGFPHIAFDTVHNDADAFQKLQENKTYELIISDWDYEYVDGHKLLVKLRQDKVMAGVPFIIITQRRDKESIMACLKLSVTEYLMMPIENKAEDEKGRESILFTIP